MAHYARVVGESLGDLIGVACTVNEPNIVALMGYLMGLFPPAQSDWARFSKVNVAMRACHVAMRDALRSTPGDYPIGMPLSMHEYEALPGGEELVDSFRREMEDEYLRSVGDDDFIGVQCYTKLVFGPDGLIATRRANSPRWDTCSGRVRGVHHPSNCLNGQHPDHHDRERDRHR